MTTRAREVEAWLREQALHCVLGYRDLSGTTAAEHLQRASALSALIAECEEAKEILNQLIDFVPKATWAIALERARAFIAKHAPTPELITGEVGEEK